MADTLGIAPTSQTLDRLTAENEPRARYVQTLVDETVAHRPADRGAWIACQVVRGIIGPNDDEFRVLVELFGWPTSSDVDRAEQTYGPAPAWRLGQLQMAIATQAQLDQAEALVAERDPITPELEAEKAGRPADGPRCRSCGRRIAYRSGRFAWVHLGAADHPPFPPLTEAELRASWGDR